jgi:endonuclease/exonuclease/phosphatase family metal-dependent hydrolase
VKRRTSPWRRRPTYGLVVLALIIAGGCDEGRRIKIVRSETACRVAEQTGSLANVSWFRPATDPNLIDLERWCETVGPPVVATPGRVSPVADPSIRSGDSLVVVSWNVHVGQGDVTALARRLRAELDATGTPAHIIILLQEALRRDASVPVRWADGVKAPDAIRPGRGRAADIVTVARELNLWMFYAPSMRNGDGTAPDLREDRGNAILSTRPFTNPRVIELPFRQQRRVAVSVDLPIGLEAADQIRFVSAHVDTREGADQAAALAQLLAEWKLESPLFVGSDLNALLGTLDGRVRRVNRAVRRHDCGGQTFLHLFSLDHMFISLDGWVQRCGVLGSRLGSDHAPLVARLVVP